MANRYGLSCGFWSNRPGRIDRHIWAHLQVNPMTEVFDVFDEDYNGEKLHQCKDGIG